MDRYEVIQKIHLRLQKAGKEQLARVVQIINDEFMLSANYSANEKVYTIDSVMLDTSQLRHLLDVLSTA